jgi:hypothetical protein
MYVHLLLFCIPITAIHNSDDFYPRDAASHGSHLYSNAFNSLLIGHCGLQVSTTAEHTLLQRECKPLLLQSVT